MIDRDVFAEVWARLCRRFNRESDMAELQDYLAYLDASGLSTAEFVAAADAAWATREFFPRPADFLAGEGVRGWRALLDLCAISPHAEIDADGEDRNARARIEARKAVPDRAWKAIQAIGGTDMIRNAKDLSYVRREYLSAFEAQVQEDAMGYARLPQRQPTPAIERTTGGQPVRLIAAPPKELSRMTGGGAA